MEIRKIMYQSSAMLMLEKTMAQKKWNERRKVTRIAFEASAMSMHKWKLLHATIDRIILFSNIIKLTGKIDTRMFSHQNNK